MRRRLALLPIALVPAVALAACATPSSGEEPDLQIVASTSVYADLVASIVGDAASVTAIIDSTAQDPHSYELTARDRLRIESADLVVANGGGYDPFIDSVLETMDATPPTVIAVDALGLVPEDAEAEADEHAEEEHAAEEAEHAAEEAEHAADDHDHDHAHIEGFNEHIWYDLHAMHDLVGLLTTELSALEPDAADAFSASGAELADAIDALAERAHAQADTASGATAVVTEPVPLALLAELGVTDATPEGFSEAIEEGTDVAPALLAETVTHIGSGAVSVVVVNTQTAGAETDAVVAAAEQAGVPIVDVTETLPDGEDYIGWMTANVDALESALTAR